MVRLGVIKDSHAHFFFSFEIFAEKLEFGNFFLENFGKFRKLFYKNCHFTRLQFTHCVPLHCSTMGVFGTTTHPITGVKTFNISGK